MDATRTTALDSEKMRLRYGRTGRRVPRALVWLLVLGALGAMGWVATRPNPKFSLIAYDIVGADRVDLLFTVTTPRSIPVECVVAAFDGEGYTLGYARVPVAGKDEKSTVRYSLRTLSRAQAVKVQGCESDVAPARIEQPNWRSGVTPPDQPWSSGS